MKSIRGQLFFILIVLFPAVGFSQKDTDSLSNELKTKLFNNLNHFSFGFYVDSYVTMQLEGKGDTSSIIPYFANCPMPNQIRLNVAALEIYYNADRVRGKLQLQYGDAPNLLSAPEKQFIKTIRQAAIGFQVVKDLWIDAGYMFTPVGVESAWPVMNYLSTATLCGYFGPGAILGAKLSYKFSDKVNAGIMAGNPYSLAYQQTNHLAGVLFVNYQPRENLSLAYNCIFGNQALRNAQIDNNLLYSDVLMNWTPLKNLETQAQVDFAFQTNSKMAPDTNRIAGMASGFALAKYAFLKYFSVTGRYEFYYDPDGFLSGVFTYDGKTTGLSAQGGGLGLQYKPVKFAYIRAEYKYIHANKGNYIYYGKTSDHLNALIFTVGARF